MTSRYWILRWRVSTGVIGLIQWKSCRKEKNQFSSQTSADDVRPLPCPNKSGIRKTMNNSAETDVFFVVVNHEEQYSVWPTYREIPLGWKKVGVAASKDKCLAEIERLWTDMRPLSIRQQAGK
jgi:MbtH protein